MDLYLVKDYIGMLAPAILFFLSIGMPSLSVTSSREAKAFCKVWLISHIIAIFMLRNLFRD